jgi:hypothetical protein
MNALFIISDFGTIKEFQFNYVNQDYDLFMATIKNLGYQNKFIISTEKCMNIKYVHKDKYASIAEVSYMLPAIDNKELRFSSEVIKKTPLNTHYIYYIFRACSSCAQCKKHTATFKKAQVCLYCAKSYKSLFYGKEEILY